MVIRHVNTFQKSVQVNNVYINRWAPQQQAAPKVRGGGTNWAMLGGLFMGLAQGISGGMATRQTQQPVTPQQTGPTPEEKTAKQLANLEKIGKTYGYTVVEQDGTFMAVKDGEEPITGDFQTVANGMAARSAKPSDKAASEAAEIAETRAASEAEDGAGGPEISYRKEENPDNLETVKTILYGGPWHYAQYYKDADGNAITPGSAEFNEIVNILKTEMGEVEGDRSQRTLPKTITAGGKQFTLMDEASRDKLGLKGNPGGADTRYNVKQNGSTFSVYKTKNGQEKLLKSGLTEAEADKLINDKA